MPSYLCRTYLLPPELEESLTADLWQQGTLGASVEAAPDGRLRLTAWFPAPAGGSPPVSSSSGGSPPLAAGVELVAEAVQPDADWMTEYRRQAVPFALGRSLWIDPREPDEAPATGAPDRRLLRLPARTAFGIGSHASTSLAIELLEGACLAGRSVLDAGTGTGILAFAALAWGAARVVGFDCDLVAAFQARTNSRLNDLHPALLAGRAAAFADPAGFDLVIANVIPEEILPDLDDLLPALAPGGTLILSGLTVEHAAAVAGQLAARGLAETGRRRDGEWVALQLVRGAHAGAPAAASDAAAASGPAAAFDPAAGSDR